MAPQSWAGLSQGDASKSPQCGGSTRGGRSRQQPADELVVTESPQAGSKQMSAAARVSSLALKLAVLQTEGCAARRGADRLIW